MLYSVTSVFLYYYRHTVMLFLIISDRFDPSLAEEWQSVHVFEKIMKSGACQAHEHLLLGGDWRFRKLLQVGHK